MKILRAILTGILFWVLIFFEVSILMFGLKLTLGVLYYIIHFIILFFLVAIVSLIYFRKAKSGIGQGFILGIIFVVVGVILDSIITIPLFMQMDYNFLIREDILVGYFETIIVACLIGVAKK